MNAADRKMAPDYSERVNNMARDAFVSGLCIGIIIGMSAMFIAMVFLTR